MKKTTKFGIVEAVFNRNQGLINKKTLEINYTKALAIIRKKGIMTTNREDSFKRTMRQYRQNTIYNQIGSLYISD